MIERGRKSWNRTATVLGAGVVVSLLIHGFVFMPAFIAVMSADRTRPVLLARFDPEDFQQPPEDEMEQEPRLGIEQSSDPSTLSWIGHEEYQEHLAQLAEQDQAAFTTEPAGSPAEPMPPEQTAADQPTPTDQLLARLEQRLEDLDTGEGRIQRNSDEPSPVPTAGRKSLEEVLAELEKTLVEAQETPQPVPPQPQPQPATVAANPGAETDPADVADLESDATSTLDIPWDKVNLGRPVAGEGITIKPRKPEFTTLVRMTAMPGNPLVVIRFGRDGVPKTGTRVLEGSGDPRVDEAINNSLYRWRAAGERIRALGPDETLKVKIRIVLTKRNR